MRKAWKWAIAGVAVVLLSPVGYEAVYFHHQFQLLNDGATVASRFLVALDAHQYEAAHAMLTVEQQRSISLTTMRSAEERQEKKHGVPVGKPAMDEHHANDAYDHITFFYDQAFGHSDGMPIMVRTARTPDGWRVCEYHYDYSPA